MGFLSRGNERALEGGVPGTARVLASKVLEPGYEPGEDKYSTWDEVSRAFDLGKQPYELKLEVTTNAHAPFEVEGRFKVPRKAESYSRFKQGRIRTGLELPVRVGSGTPPRVDIDWGRWMADPERKRKMDENEAYMREVTLRRMAEREAKRKHPDE